MCQCTQTLGPDSICWHRFCHKSVLNYEAKSAVDSYQNFMKTRLFADRDLAFTPPVYMPSSPFLPPQLKILAFCLGSSFQYSTLYRKSWFGFRRFFSPSDVSNTTSQILSQYPGDSVGHFLQRLYDTTPTCELCLDLIFRWLFSDRNITRRPAELPAVNNLLYTIKGRKVRHFEERIDAFVTAFIHLCNELPNDIIPTRDETSPSWVKTIIDLRTTGDQSHTRKLNFIEQIKIYLKASTFEELTKSDAFVIMSNSFGFMKEHLQNR
ncbi:hypothetical protein GEMRC1_000637 [Eukaryota sp. GEM-RC1]